MPDDTCIFEYSYRLNNLHFPIMEEKIYLSRVRRSFKKIKYIKNGEVIEKKQELFEVYFREGIPFTMEMMKQDNLRHKRKNEFPKGYKDAYIFSEEDFKC